MKDDEMRNQVLLADSGELAAEPAARLRRALQADDELRTYAVDVDRLTEAAREALLCEGPSATVLARIREEAGRRYKTIAFSGWRATALAAAAMLVLLAGGAMLWRWRAAPTTPSRAVAQRAAQAQTLTALIVMMSEEEAESAAGAVLREADLALPEEQHVRILASQLLRMEGLEADAADSEIEVAPDLSSAPGGEPSPQRSPDSVA